MTRLKFGGGLTVAFLVALTGCDLQMPGLPQWTIEATIPFSQRVYKFREIATDSAKFDEQGWGFLINETDSVLRFEFRDSLKRQEIGDRLTYDRSEIGSYVNYIGIINIEEPIPDADTVTVQEANPIFGAGWTGVVEPFQLQQAQDTLQYNIFEWVRVNEGWMRIKVVNGYPFDLEAITLEMRNLTDGSLIGRADFPNRIPPGGEVTDSVDLAGHLVFNEILLTADGRSPGTDAAVTIRGDEVMQLIIGISSSKVDSARAEISAQSFDEPHRLDLSQANKIVEAEIKSGRAHFRLRNTTRMKLAVQMRFDNFTDSLGNPMTTLLSMDPESAGEIIDLDLTGARLSMPLNDQSLYVTNFVEIEDSRITRYQGDSYQTIAGYQGVEIDYWTDDLILKTLRGVLDSIQVDIPEERTVIKLPNGLENITFTRDTLFIHINNGSGMPMRLNLQVVGINSQTNQTEVVPIQSSINPGPTRIAILDIDRLTNVLPDQITFEGAVSLGTRFFPKLADSVGDIRDVDDFEGYIRLKSDLKFTMGTTRIITDIAKLEEALDYPIQEVSVHLNIINQMPLAGVVNIQLGNDTTHMNSVIRAQLPRGDIIEHRSPGTAYETTLLLDSSAINILRRTPAYTRQVIELESSGGDTLWLDSRDSISVQASATIRYLINEPDEGK